MVQTIENESTIMDPYEQKLDEWRKRHGVTAAMIPGTREHSDAEDLAQRVSDKKLKGEDYCVLCGEGPQPISGMELITRMDDPYIQPEDDSDEDPEDRLPAVENRVRACPKCWAIEYGPEAVELDAEINPVDEDGQPPDDKS